MSTINHLKITMCRPKIIYKDFKFNQDMAGFNLIRQRVPPKYDRKLNILNM